jgi:hypothetical protein
MHKQSCPPLTVATEGFRSFINVPSGFAADLHHYLRAHSVLTSPPEPLWTGTDCIQLAKGADPTAVQRLLDGWEGGPGR